MASVEEVKVGVARFGDEAGKQIGQIRALTGSLEQTSSMLRTITSGTSHAAVGDALTRLEQAKQRLTEAATLTQGAVETTRNYAATF